MHYINPGEILSNFVLFTFCLILTQIEKNSNIKFCSFCPDNLNQHCTSSFSTYKLLSIFEMEYDWLVSNIL